MSIFEHKSVLLSESITGLNINPEGIYIDATLGGGGHSEAILRHLTTGKMIGIDRDGDAIEASRKRLECFGERFIAVRSNYSEIESVLQTLSIPCVSGVLFDLGVSSYQLDTPERGFSYMADAPLDMRMDSRDCMTAADVVNTYSESDIKRILYEFGDEKFASRIASEIVRARNEKPIQTTFELSNIITSAIPAASAKKEKQHPAKRSFQAIRMEVNAELQSVAKGVRAAAEALAPEGRLCVITFHSGEDRIVKKIISDLSTGCTCPRDFPVCVCGKKPVLKQITKHPIISCDEELMDNPRARSAKLRIAEKI